MLEQFKKILQDELPVRPWQQEATRRLPGIQPLDLSEWILIDEVFAKQMAYRDWLLENERDLVFQQLEDFDQSIAQELLDMVCEDLKTKEGFSVSDSSVTRPDGVVVERSGELPLIIAARLVQQDLLLMESRGGDLILTAAVLCFPASWSLKEKLGKSLMGIHLPVKHYEEDLNKRVLRLFEAIKPDRPLWRANYLCYEDPNLFQPRTEDNRRYEGIDYMRVERQALRRLPQSNAVLFSLHTYVVKMQSSWREELAIASS